MVLPVGGRKPGIPDRTGFELNTVVGRIDPGTAGSPLQRLGVDANGNPVWFDDIINVQQAGAKGDDTTDNSAVLQDLIDEYTTDNDGPGAVLAFPPTGDPYRANIELKSGIILWTPGAPMGRIFEGIRLSTLRGYTTDPVVDTPASAIYCAGIIGLNIEGTTTGPATGTVGVNLNDANRCVFSNMNIAQFKYQGMVTGAGGSNFYEALFLNSCLTDREVDFDIGVFELDGNDHLCIDIEANASLNVSVQDITSSDLHQIGVYVKAGTSRLYGVYGEFSDRGFVLAGNNNNLVACRGEYSYGHDFVISGRDNQLVGCKAYNGGLAQTDTYDGFVFTNTSRANQLIGPRAMRRHTAGTPQDGKYYRYAFNDQNTASGINERNIVVGELGTQFTTAERNFASQFNAAGTISPKHVYRPSGNPTTLNVEHVGVVSLGGYDTATTITRFAGGNPGDDITLIGDTDVTLKHGADTTDNIRTSTGADLTLEANKAYKFTLFNNVWYQVV